MQAGVFIGVGGNLSKTPWPTPRHVLEAALAVLGGDTNIRLVRRSPWYRTRPWPPSAQPWCINGVVEIATLLPPGPLLDRLHRLESQFGRVRRERNEARILDLDLLAYADIISDPADLVLLPHPRMHERPFVLVPLCDIAPGWRHPKLHHSAAELLAALAPEQLATVRADDDA